MGSLIRMCPINNFQINGYKRSHSHSFASPFGSRQVNGNRPVKMLVLHAFWRLTGQNRSFYLFLSYTQQSEYKLLYHGKYLKINDSYVSISYIIIAMRLKPTSHCQCYNKKFFLHFRLVNIWPQSKTYPTCDTFSYKPRVIDDSHQCYPRRITIQFIWIFLA